MMNRGIDDDTSPPQRELRNPPPSPQSKTTTSTTSTSRSLVERLNILLQHSEKENAPYRMERLLVGWVLLFSIDDENDLVHVWKKYGSILEEFATNILLHLHRGDDNDNNSNKHNGVEKDDDEDDDDELSLLYLQLVCQVTARLPTTVYPKRIGEAIWKKFSHQLPFVKIDVSSSVRSSLSSSSSSSLDRPTTTTTTSTIPSYPPTCNAGKSWRIWSDVCWSADIYFQVDPLKASKWVPILFQFLYQDPSLHSLSTTSSSSSTTKTAATTPDIGTSSQLTRGKESRAMMIQTLSHILLHGSNSTISLYDIHNTMLHLLARESILSSITDLMAMDMMDFVIIHNLFHHPQNDNDNDDDENDDDHIKTIQSSWHRCCLQWILTQTISVSKSTRRKNVSSSSSTTTPIVKRVLFQRPTFLPHFNQWLLSQLVISTDKDSMECRNMTWQVVATLTDLYGWGWMMTVPTTTTTMSMLERIPGPENVVSSTKNFGSAKYFCTWMRLACGELRILLQSSLLGRWDQEVSSSDANNNATTKESSESISFLEQDHTCEACAQIVQNGVTYILDLVDHHEQSHIGSILNTETVLYLRQSLEEALWTCVEYLTLITSTTTTQNPSRIFTVILSLLGTLLMEVDIFSITISPNLIPDNDEDDEDKEATLGGTSDDEMILSSPRMILKCLSRVLPIAQDPILLPGLVHILSSIQNDEGGRIDKAKSELIQNYLQDSLRQYLDWFWQNHENENKRKFFEDNNTVSGKPTTRTNVVDVDWIDWAVSCTELLEEMMMMGVNQKNTKSS